jgi:hypothetical protein
MTTGNVRNGNVVGPNVDSSLPQPEVELNPNGTKRSMRLSACTFGQAVQLFAPALSKGAGEDWAREHARGFLAHPACVVAEGESVHAAELHYGLRLMRIRLVGCTVEQALLLCKFVVAFDALADNHWLDDLMPDPDVFTVLSQCGWR